MIVGDVRQGGGSLTLGAFARPARPVFAPRYAGPPVVAFRPSPSPQEQLAARAVRTRRLAREAMQAAEKLAKWQGHLAAEAEAIAREIDALPPAELAAVGAAIRRLEKIETEHTKTKDQTP